MHLCPELREAYRSGRLSWTKAQCLVPLLALPLPEDWRTGWVAWAQRVTVRRLEADVARGLLLRAGTFAAWHRCKHEPARAQDPLPPEERQTCALDVDVEATQELGWRLPREVAALFAALQRAVARRPDPVLERDGWRCAVPGCSGRRNLHDHHLVFRAAGGGDDAGNRVTLCAFHHLRGVHAGHLAVRGRAPDALVFELGLRAGAPPLLRYRSGDVAVA